MKASAPAHGVFNAERIPELKGDRCICLRWLSSGKPSAKSAQKIPLGLNPAALLGVFVVQPRAFNTWIHFATHRVAHSTFRPANGGSNV